MKETSSAEVPVVSESSATEKWRPPLKTKTAQTPAPDSTGSPPSKETKPAETHSSESAKFTLGRRKKLGPAGPVTAISTGAIFITRDEHIVLTQWPEGTSPTKLKEQERELARYGRGPSHSATHAYWISEKGQLLRASLKTKQVEVLFSQARAGTRTTAIALASGDAVAFIGEIEGSPLAFLWAEIDKGRGEVVQISPDGSTATSTAIFLAPSGPQIISLAGRTGMSPVHLRSFGLSEKHLNLDEDQVVWIGPGSNSLTEIWAFQQKRQAPVAFLATARDFDSFGLAQLALIVTEGQLAEPLWNIYANGLDPAPVSTGRFCGEDYVLYVRPKDQSPDSKKQLRLAPIDKSAPGEGVVVSTAQSVYDVSLAKTERGALIVWTAGRSTWAKRLTCSPPEGEEDSAQPIGR